MQKEINIFINLYLISLTEFINFHKMIVDVKFINKELIPYRFALC